MRSASFTGSSALTAEEPVFFASLTSVQHGSAAICMAGKIGICDNRFSMEDTYSDKQPTGIRFQFGLASLLAAITALCLVLAFPYLLVLATTFVVLLLATLIALAVFYLFVFLPIAWISRWLERWFHWISRSLDRWFQQQ